MEEGGKSDLARSAKTLDLYFPPSCDIVDECVPGECVPVYNLHLHGPNSHVINHGVGGNTWIGK